MRKALAVWLVYGWFFLAQAPFEGEAVIVSQVGPFKTESECRGHQLAMKEMLEALQIPGSKISKCIYRQET